MWLLLSWCLALVLELAACVFKQIVNLAFLLPNLRPSGWCVLRTADLELRAGRLYEQIHARLEVWHLPSALDRLLTNSKLIHVVFHADRHVANTGPALLSF